MYRQCIRHSMLTKTAMHTACAVHSAVYQTLPDTQHYVLPDKWQCTQPCIQCYIMAHCIDSKITSGIANALSRKSVYSSLHYVLAYVDSSFCFAVILSELLYIYGESLHTKSNRWILTVQWSLCRHAWYICIILTSVTSLEYLSCGEYCDTLWWDCTHEESDLTPPNIQLPRWLEKVMMHY